MNNELEGMWKEAVMTYLKLPLRNLYGGNGGKLQKPSSGQSVPRWRFELNIFQMKVITA
jgi:hypothetical protein